ncbi:MAG: flagellar protein FlgN [Nitrospinae bacterium]|nr:flagellar protein FlgN [Nitrospinota bacterium]
MEISGLIEELESILSLNIKLYNQMETALEEEFSALKTHSIGQLDGAIKRKLSLAANLRAVEDARLKVIEKISKALGVPVKHIRIRDLAERTGGEAKARLMAIREDLNTATARVTEKNDLNRGFIEKLVTLNASAASNLKELIAPESTYERTGPAAISFKPGQVVSRTF